MNRLPIAIGLGLALLASGCRSSRNQELLERDLRWQEDRIRSLQAHCDELHQQLEAYQQENDSLKQGISTPVEAPRRRRPFQDQQNSPSDDVRTPDLKAPDVSLPDLQVPKVDLPGAEQAPPFQGPPQISPPNPSVPEGEKPANKPTPAPQSGTSNEPPRDLLPQHELPAPSGPDIEPRLIPSADGGDPSRVMRITLNRAQTKGYNADEFPGDEGVSVTVEPRDSSGKVLRASGKLSIVVLDPTLSGNAARVARWNFTEEDAAAHHRPGADALHFDLRWPEQLPKNSNLKLYVRLTRADGQKFDAEQDLHITVPPQTAADWTRSRRPLTPRKTISTPIETTPIAPAVTPESAPPSTTPAPASGDRTVRGGVQWTPYR